jgi:orotate phosphoribosyltransferase
MNKKVGINDYEIAQSVAKLLLEIKAFDIKLPPSYFTYTSGLKSPIYLDNRLVMSYPKTRRKILDYYIEFIIHKIQLENVEWISATATSAIPLGAWIAERLRLPMVYYRPTSKLYGKGKQIEGYLREGSKVLIIEDHISTGMSAVEHAKAVREGGAKVNYCIATTTYETQEAQNNFRDNEITLIALTTGKIIVETAIKEGLLNQKDKEIVDLWFLSPQKWAESFGL